VLVGEALDALAGVASPIVADLCTGSGCVACSIASEHRGARVYASELSGAAVLAARGNAERLGMAGRVTVEEGDLFGPLPPELRGRVDAVVSNPPYVPTSDLPDLPEEVFGYEPHLALDGGEDGLDVARRIMGEAPGWLRPGGVLLMELDERRVDDAAVDMEAWYEGVRTVSDLTGRPRIVFGRTPEADTTRAG
jgi:release factor glutamine methyltransferase